jgi:hypothetical protein
VLSLPVPPIAEEPPALELPLTLVHALEPESPPTDVRCPPVGELPATALLPPVAVEPPAFKPPTPSSSGRLVSLLSTHAESNVVLMIPMAVN